MITNVANAMKTASHAQDLANTTAKTAHQKDTTIHMAHAGSATQHARHAPMALMQTARHAMTDTSYKLSMSTTTGMNTHTAQNAEHQTAQFAIQQMAEHAQSACPDTIWMATHVPSALDATNALVLMDQTALQTHALKATITPAIAAPAAPIHAKLALAVLTHAQAVAKDTSSIQACAHIAETTAAHAVAEDHAIHA